LSLTVVSGLGDKDFLSSLKVFSFTIPSLDGRVLKSSSVRERERPWGLDVGDLVHGVQVSSGFVFTLASREEHDAWNSRWDGSGEGSDSLVSNFLSRDVLSVGVRSTRGDHVWL